jgi:hypothetical protein
MPQSSAEEYWEPRKALHLMDFRMDKNRLFNSLNCRGLLFRVNMAVIAHNEIPVMLADLRISIEESTASPQRFLLRSSQTTASATGSLLIWDMSVDMLGDITEDGWKQYHTNAHRFCFKYLMTRPRLR